MTWKKTALLSAILVAATVIVYAPAMTGGFIWDDDRFLTQNPLIRADDGLRRFWFSTEPQDYFPLTSTALWLEWRLWGDWAGGYHLTNVLLHALSAVLVWRALLRLQIPGAWLAGLFVAVHPVNAASVVWITERKNTLSMALYLASILAYLSAECRVKNAECRVNDERHGPQKPLSGDSSFCALHSAFCTPYALSVLLFLLALLAKTSVAMLPVVLLGLVWWRRGKTERKDLLRVVPFFVLAGVFALVEIWFQDHRAIAGAVVRPEGFFSRLAAAGWAVWFYLYKALLPLDLSMVYPRWQVDPARWAAWLPLAALAACSVLFWRYRGGWGRPFLATLGYVVIILFPVLGFFDITFMRLSLVADHWQYLAIPGVMALAAGLATCGLSRLSGPARRAGIVAVAAVACALGAGTFCRALIDGNEEMLWRDTLEKNPACWAAHNNLGNALLRQGKLPEAMAVYEEALRLNPDYAEAHYNMGNVLLALRKPQEAISHLQRAVKQQPEDANYHWCLANALAQAGRDEEAQAERREALRLNPKSVSPFDSRIPPP